MAELKDASSTLLLTKDVLWSTSQPTPRQIWVEALRAGNTDTTLLPAQPMDGPAVTTGTVLLEVSAGSQHL